MMNQHLRPPSPYDEKFLIVRFAMDAFTTNQSSRTIAALVALDTALADALKHAPARELDRI